MADPVAVGVDPENPKLPALVVDATRPANPADADDNGSLMTPADTAAVLTYVSIPPSGDTTGATDTAAIQAAIDTATAATPVCIGLHVGTYCVAGLVLRSYVTITGAGRDRTTLKLPDGANQDLITSADFATLTVGTTQGGIRSWSLKHLTLHGNRANNTTGWPLRVYGADYQIDDIAVTEGKSGGVWTQWGIGGTNMEAHWSDFKIYNCEGNLLHNVGPHDSLFSNGSVFNDGTLTGSTGTLYHGGSNSHGAQLVNCHFWGHCNTGVYAGGGHFFDNCQVEGAKVQNLLMAANGNTWTGGHIFGTNGAVADVEIGVKFGSSLNVSSNLVVGTMFSQFDANSFPVVWQFSDGGNMVIGTLRQSTATRIWTGTPHASDVTIMQDPGGTASLDGVGDLAVLPRAAHKSALWLPGTTGNYVSAPDATALGITGDITLVAEISPDDWTNAAAILIGKRSSASTFSYRLVLTAAGGLQIGFSPDGTDAASTTLSSSANLGALANGTRRFVAATLDVDDGAGNKVAKFWSSLDGRIWTQLGTTVTSPGTATIFDSTSPIELGSNAGGTANLYAGKIHSASIRSGIGPDGAVGGSEVLAYDADKARGNRYRDAYGNVFTHNGTGWALATAA